MISDAGVAAIVELGLTVVTQPAFIFERGRPLSGERRGRRPSEPLPMRQPAQGRRASRGEFGFPLRQS